MNELILDTARLKLVLQTPAEALAQIEASSPADRAEMSPEWLERIRATTTADPWLHGFRVVLRVSDRVIGSAGFKGPPDADGVVEIAYGIDPEHQGQGFATEAAQAMTAYAWTRAEVRIVRAHTLPEPNASTRVLTKCGFRHVGEYIDPHDGLVWRWERHPNIA